MNPVPADRRDALRAPYRVTAAARLRAALAAHHQTQAARTAGGHLERTTHPDITGTSSRTDPRR